MRLALVTNGGFRPVMPAGNAKNKQTGIEVAGTTATLKRVTIPDGMRVVYAPPQLLLRLRPIR